MQISPQLRRLCRQESDILKTASKREQIAEYDQKRFDKCLFTKADLKSSELKQTQVDTGPDGPFSVA